MVYVTLILRFKRERNLESMKIPNCNIMKFVWWPRFICSHMTKLTQ